MAYTPPTAKEGVYFTRDLTQNNYNYGTNVIAEWSRKNPTIALKLGLSYQGYLDYLGSNYPTYIEYLGTLVDEFGTTPVFQVADQVANNGKFTYPTPSDWANSVTALLGDTPSFVSTLGAGISDAATAVVGDIETGLSVTLIAVVLIVIFAGVLIYQGKVKIPI